MKKAVLMTLNSDTTEIEALMTSLGYSVTKKFFQQRDKPDVNTYVGRGKIKEIKDFLEENKDVDVVVVDGELKPSQWFNLEKETGKEVYDRIRLILSLFAERAESMEAKLQVKLAQLRYERPFVRELIHRARAGEHPGFMAGGEYQVDDYYEMIKRQMKQIKEKLEKLRASREIRRKHRYEAGFYLIAIAGYTNAGKSSLLNLLADEQVRVEEMLFSTLSPTTRRVSKKRFSETTKPPLLLTDTVGFIRDLPSWVIDAFHSTLEEIAVADLILLLIDVSDPVEEIKAKLQTSIRELNEISAQPPVVLVFNKMDLIDNETLNFKMNQLKNLIDGVPHICISISKRLNIDKLIEIISKNLPSLVEGKMILPFTKEAQRFVSTLYKKTWVFNIEYSDKIRVDLAVNQRILDKLISLCKRVGGRFYTAK
ncbi:MAG TPA: GTPase HflX [Thermoplasmatales archaeon]|nr:GTPase HflX [Thermoplasmatales archaeon]